MRKTKEVLRLRFELGLGSARLHAVAGWGWPRFISIWKGPRQLALAGRCRKA
jgi:hypothetical protein